MQQLDGKWSQWWQQSQHMHDTLQQQVAALGQQQDSTAQRLDHLQDQVMR